MPMCEGRMKLRGESMSVNIQSIEESLSVSYVSAIVAKSGASFDIVSRDFGVDVCVRNVENFNGQLIDVGVAYDCQLKATINWDMDDESVVYDLEADTYNKLVYRHSRTTYPCILILLCLPKEECEWINITDEELKLRKCCYYYYLSGDPTLNKKKIRIRIPKQNIFSPEVVKKLIDDVYLGVMK